MDSIRRAIETTSDHLARHPEAGVRPDTTAIASLEEGLRVRVRGPDGEVSTDMGPAVGGAGSGPTPGWLMRAALASCDATGIAMEAARDGVELTELTVTVDSESDSRGALGVGDAVPAGPLAVTVRIELAARNATEGQLREIVRRAGSRSPIGDALGRAISVTTEVVTSSGT